MRNKLTRFIIVAVVVLICVISLPLHGFSLSVEDGSGATTNKSDNDFLYKDITGASESNKKQLLTPGELANRDLTLDSALLLTPDSEVSTIENALYNSGFVYKLQSTTLEVNNKYTDTNDSSDKSRVILTTKLFYTSSNSNQDGQITKTLGDYLPNGITIKDYNGVTGMIYLKKNSNDKSDVKFVLRYYIYKEKRGIGSGPEDDTLVYIKDYDFTPILKSIIESKKDTTNSPIVSYLRSEYSNYFEDIKNMDQKKQQTIWEIYKRGTSLSNYTYKTFFDRLNDFILSAGLKNAPELPDDLNFTNQIEFYIYSQAIKRSALFDTDLTYIFDGINLSDDTWTQASDWERSSHKAMDIVTAVSGANIVADKYNNSSSSYTEIGLESNAGLFYDLIRYRYGKISGATERGIGSSATDERVVNDRLELLLLNTDNLYGRNINPMLYDQYSTLTIFGYAVPIKEYADVFASLQMLEFYASVENGSSGLTKEENGIMNSLLDVEIGKNKEKPANEWGVIESGDLVKQIKTYKQIKEGLDFLGIKPWTNELIYIYEKYNAIKDIELSEGFNDYDNSSDTEPLKRFFSFTDKTLSINYMTGIALSATYIPMQTNLYDPTSIRVLKNEDWLRDFHIRYGFYRKALMIDTNVNAAVDGYVTGSRDSSRPALLSDLLQYNKDIVLYVDDNFYNTNEAAEMTDKVYERLANTEQAGMGDESFSGWFDNLFNNSIEHILKTGSRGKYDESIINDVSTYGRESPLIDWSGLKESMFTNGIIFGSGNGPNDDTHNDIKKGLDQKEYSIKQPYAIVSGIYRHKDLANYLNIIADKPKPMFVSSPALFNVKNIPQYEFNSIYNYYMLRNLESSMGIDYKTTLDVDNPVYIDIYGNIITESGLVVIPAASNATLYPNGTYSPYTLGFMDLYSNGDNIKYNNRWDEYSPFKKYLIDFQTDDSGKILLQKNYELNSVPVNPQRPSVADSALLEVLYDNQVSLLNKQGYDFKQRAWLITEVLRGAPLENIVKEKEGLVGKRDISKYGLYMSWKLDEIADMLLPTTNGNSIISMPNLSFMDGIEYIVLFAFKFMLLLFVTYIMYQVYIDAIGGKLGLRTLWSCVSTIIVFCLCICAIPSVISYSYNEPNKIFLQDEIKYINLLNYEKYLEGREISAVGVTAPKSQTKLYLKLDTIKVPWYKVLQNVMFAPVGITLDKLYEEELENNILYGFEDIQVVNDGVYIDVDDIFASSSIIYNNNQKFLYQNMNTVPTASYFIPYYYLMDNMLSSINMYNRDNGIINITTKIQSDGSVKTMGMIGDYLLSEYFLMEANDPLGLYDLYGINTNEKTTFINEETDDFSTTKNSMWYVFEHYNAEDCASMIDQLYSHMRAYVAQNRQMIGRVTDETFLKTMMLDISMEYNQIFRIPAAKGIEVFSIDSRDLIRLSITDKNAAVISASNSFGKFVYEESGGLGVILTAILLGIYFITSIVKPALVILLCVILIYNSLIKRMISAEKGKTIEGLLYVLSVLVVINSTYALMLKLSMSLPTLGLGTAVSIIGQIIIQAGYLWFVFLVVGVIFKDISNLGYTLFHAGMLSIAGVINSTATSVYNKATYSKEQQEYMESAKFKNESHENQESILLREEMDARDRHRNEAQEDTAFMDEVFNRDTDR